MRPVDHHFGADVERVPTGGDQRVTLFGVHAVEHRRQGTLGAEAGERMQIVLILVGVAERSGDGQRDAIRHAVGDGGTAGGGEPVIVAFPSGHERHGFAAESDDLVHAVAVRVVDHGTVTQAIPCAAQARPAKTSVRRTGRRFRKAVRPARTPVPRHLAGQSAANAARSLRSDRPAAAFR